MQPGDSGNDVLALQTYLNLIARTYTSIPTVAEDGDFGPATEAALRAFVTQFELSYEPTRVNAALWYAITNVYDDLYNGNSVAEGQFSGTTIS